MIRDCSEAVAYLAGEIRKSADIAVLGMSGGADSTLVAVLCSIALGNSNVFGVSMPYDEDDAVVHNSMSAAVARKLGINHLLRPIREIVDAINAQIVPRPGASLSMINMGNSRSRARMCVLYGLAHALAADMPGRRVRTIGTGNLSEAFIGYCTKGGDAACDFFPIADLFKSEVYQLLDYFRGSGMIAENDINRVPTASLYPGQTDEEELGYTYTDIEKAIRFCMDHYDEMDGCELDKVTAFVWSRHLANKHKIAAPPVIKARHLCT